MGDDDIIIRILTFQRSLLLMITTQIKERSSRNLSLFDQRLLWCDFLSKFGNPFHFKRLLRMNESSFNKLLSYIYNDLEVNSVMSGLRGGAILPEFRLYITLRYLAGGSYLDIKLYTGISTSSFYHIIWETISVIINCPQLSINFPSTIEQVYEAAEGFQSISSNDAIINCVTVVDGYHLKIKTPAKSAIANTRSCFSGHYQSYGLNVQAACDHQCRFLCIGVAGPGNMGDRDAVNEIALGRLIESLPGKFCAIGDCAYTATEHLVPIFRGDLARLEIHDNFNFFASQLRIRIEMAFGLMVQKWCILQKPLLIKVENIKWLVIAVGMLHNFCINERLLDDTTDNIFNPQDVSFDERDTAIRITAADRQFEDMFASHGIRWSLNRDEMARRIRDWKLTRP
jgi:DDE superfamily endonuclease